MADVYEIVEDNVQAYGDTDEPVSASFRGLCETFKISKRCFQVLVEDGWDDVHQLHDLDKNWRSHVLALAPNGGQKRNLEKMLDRVEAGPLDQPVPKKKRVEGPDGQVQQDKGSTDAVGKALSSDGPGPSGTAPVVASTSATPPR
ncbi:uncharacterized protein LOC119725843 [Patiria miniata]|uniref:Uncharacterized protein n=1 Tax=Patiria miniata TaxID=46514 RepID=A0A913ZNJ7_PATMI|nr:uncharacterized protein LOC119725843 [Patiria miniata]